jgi:predicted transcriptional regulator
MTAPISPFPSLRHRRLRQSDWIRRLVRETTLAPNDLIWSMVVHDGKEARIPVASMPGNDRLSVSEAAKAAKEARALGIPAIAVFPHIDGAKKDSRGSEAGNPEGLIAQAVSAMKDAAPEVGIMCDVALDPFTLHGHDGLIENGRILNDPTIERLVEQGLMQAAAGADILAPSDMMDGRVGALRTALDPDSLLIFTAHEEPDAFVVEPILRNFAPIAPFVVRWKFPLMERDGELDPAKLKQIAGRKKRFDDSDLRKLLALIVSNDETNPVSIAEWAMRGNVPASTMRKYCAEMRDKDWIKTIGEGTRSKQAITNKGKEILNGTD